MGVASGTSVCACQLVMTDSVVCGSCGIAVGRNTGKHL